MLLKNNSFITTISRIPRTLKARRELASSFVSQFCKEQFLLIFVPLKIHIIVLTWNLH